MDIDLPGTPPTSQAMEPGSTGNTVIFSPSSRAAAAEDSPMPLIASDESGLSQPMDESGSGSAIRNLTPNLLNQQIMDHFFIQPEYIDDNIRMYATSYFKLNKELTSLQQKHIRDAVEKNDIPKKEIEDRESLVYEVEEIEVAISRYLAEQEGKRYELEREGQTGDLELTFMSGGRKSKKRKSKKRKKSKKKRSKKRKKSKNKRSKKKRY